MHMPMRRLLVLAAAVAAAVPLATPALAYDRTCGGIADTECHGWVCPTDCWQVDCLVWVDVAHNPMTALCLNPPVH